MGRWINRDPIGEEAGGNLMVFIKNFGPQSTDYLGLDINPMDPRWASRGVNCARCHIDTKALDNGFGLGDPNYKIEPIVSDLTKTVMDHATEIGRNEKGEDCGCCQAAYPPLYIRGNPLKIDCATIHSILQGSGKTFCELADAGSTSVNTSVTISSGSVALGTLDVKIKGNLMVKERGVADEGGRWVIVKFKGRAMPYDRFDFWPLWRGSRGWSGNILNFGGFMLSAGGHPDFAPSGWLLGNFDIYFDTIDLECETYICCD